MRKLLVVGAIGALAAVVVLPTTANAGGVTRFSVRTVHQRHHVRRDGVFILKGGLSRPHDTSAIIGHFKARFTKPHRQLKARAVFFFRQGKIKAQGLLTRNNRVQITGGTRAYNGAAGKIKAHGNRLHFTVFR
jgi:hypothetical protein